MNKLIYVAACIGLSVNSFGQLDRSVAPVPGPAPEINIAESETFELDNGMKVIVSTNTKQPKVSFNLVMSSAPRIEGNKAGLSDIAGDLMLSGTTNRDKDQLDNEKDFIGATLFASSDNIYLSCLTKHMEKGLDIMTDVMKNASFPESEFERIKKQYESSLASAASDANTMAANATYKSVFPENHPYGEVMTQKSLDNITREDVIDFYNKQFTPSGSYLVIVGDITFEKAKEIAQNNFASWEGGVPFEKEYNAGFFPEGNRVIFVEKPGAVQSVVTIAFPIDMKPGHEDYIKLSVLNKLLGGGGFGTRLMQNLREDKAYTYGAYSRVNVNREGAWMSASGSFRNEVTDSTIEQFLYEFERITEDLVTDEELSLNKASMAGSFARGLESPRTIANFALNIFRNDLPSDYYQTYLKRLSEVNKEDVLAVAKKYITPKNMNIIVVGNEEVVDKITRFDADGKIERLDAFGNPEIKKEYLPADLSKEEVIENYILAVTQSKNMKKANKVIGKVKSMEQIVGMKPQQAPVELTMKSYFVAPYSRYTKVEFSGMVVQKDMFNGEAGKSETMNQTGGYETKELSEEEVAARKSTSGLFPELGMQNDGVEYTLLGVDMLNDKKHYVIEYVSGNTTTKAYYDAESFLKMQTESLTVTEEEPQSSTIKYSDFQEVKGILFPHKSVQMIGSAGFEATVKEININAKVDENLFKM